MHTGHDAYAPFYEYDIRKSCVIHIFPQNGKVCEILTPENVFPHRLGQVTALLTKNIVASKEKRICSTNYAEWTYMWTKNRVYSQFHSRREILCNPREKHLRIAKQNIRLEDEFDPLQSQRPIQKDANFQWINFVITIQFVGATVPSNNNNNNFGLLPSLGAYTTDYAFGTQEEYTMNGSLYIPLYTYVHRHILWPAN